MLKNQFNEILCIIVIRIHLYITENKSCPFTVADGEAADDDSRDVVIGRLQLLKT